MTSTRRLSGAVALGLSVALTGAFAAPSFAAPAANAKLESSTHTTTTVTVDEVEEEFDQLTDLYSDGTKIVTLFTDEDGSKTVNGEEIVFSITEISPDGTETVTEEGENGEEIVTVTAKDGTVTETITDADGTVIKTVFAANGTVTETITEVLEGVDEAGVEDEDVDGTLKTVTVTTWASEEDYEEETDEEETFSTKKETVTFTTTVSTSKTVTVTAADGTVTETVTVTEKDTVKETITETKADGTESSTTRVFSKSSDTVTEIVTQAGKDGEVGTDDDVLTVTVKNADGSGTKTVYVPGATYTVDEDGEVVVDGDISTRSEIAPKPTEPTKPITFTDNPEGSAFYASVQWMAENGISVGYADGTYKKNKDVTRGETAQFLYKYEDATFPAPTTSPFTDVNVGGAFFTPITWAASEDITAGFADGSFKPSQSVTRGQFAAFLYGLEAPEHTAPTTSPFGDLNVGGAHYNAITWLASEGITVGDTQGDFNSSDAISRGEISAFMQRYDAVAAE